MKSHAADSPSDTPEVLLVGGPVHDRADLVRMANPITHLNNIAPPFLIIHGKKDDLVAADQSKLLHQALTSKGCDSMFVGIFPGTHDFWELLERS